MLDNNLEANFNYDIGDNLVSETTENKYYTNNNGVLKENTATNASCYQYPLTNGKTYLFSGFNRYGLPAMFICDSSDNILYQTPVIDSSVVEGASYLFTVKENNLKICINRLSSTNSANTKDYYATRLSEVVNIYNNLRLKSSMNEINIIENVFIAGNNSPINSIPKYNDGNGYNEYIYKISKGLSYNIVGTNAYNCPGIIVTDLSYKILYTSFEQYESTPQTVTYNFEATTDGYAILFYKENLGEHNISINYEEIISIPDNKFNRLEGKTILWNGDSICDGAGNNHVSYADMISNEFNMTYTNYAVSGRCIAKEENQTAIIDTIDSMSSTADYVIFEGGWNDMWRVPLGTISEGYNAELDEYTWSGALESLIKKSISKWPIAKIGFILAHGKANNESEINRQNSYWDRAIEVFNKWHLPYIDLRHNGLCAYNNTLLDLFFAENQTTGHGDGTHPNNLGYETFYNPKISSWLNTL